MEELKKINRIIDNEYPDAYRETLVVLDGTTGRMQLAQAKQFMEVADITVISLPSLTVLQRAVLQLPSSLNWEFL